MNAIVVGVTSSTIVLAKKENPLMTIQVDVWSDFVCPWCYAAALNLKALQTTHEVNIRWHSFELRPTGSPPMDPAYLQHIETSARPRFNQMMQESYGIAINSGKFGISSRAALIGEKVAAAHGHEDAYHEAVTKAYWVDAQNIEDVSVLVALAESVGLDRDSFLAGLSDPTYDAQVSDDVEAGAQMGLNSVPSLVFGMRYLITGAQPAEVLRQVVDKLLEEQKQGLGVGE